MTNQQTLAAKLGNIASAIRNKTGSAASMTLDQMPTAISNIDTSGGGDDYLDYINGSYGTPSNPENVTINFTQSQVPQLIADRYIKITSWNTPNISALKTGMFGRDSVATSEVE